MVVYIICFDLSRPVGEQQAQVEYWMNFLGSSLSIPTVPTTGNWTVMLAGLRSDSQTSVSNYWKVGPNSEDIFSFRTKWPQLPVFNQWFVVSSIKSRESVRLLLKSVEGECDRIFQSHANQIPISYRTLLDELEIHRNEHQSIASFQDLYGSHPCGMDENSFRQALKFLHAIGRVVYLKGDLICTNPTLVPKIAAKFIAPENVRITLLNFNTPILTTAEIGHLMEIDQGDNEQYPCFIPIFLFCYCSTQTDLGL